MINLFYHALLGKNTNLTRKIKEHEEKTDMVLYKQTIIFYNHHTKKLTYKASKKVRLTKEES